MGLFGSSKTKRNAQDVEHQKQSHDSPIPLQNGTNNGSMPPPVDKHHPLGDTEHAEYSIATADHYKHSQHHDNSSSSTRDLANGMAAPQARQELEPAEDYPQLVRPDTQDTLAVVRTISRVPGNNTYYEKYFTLSFTASLC